MSRQRSAVDPTARSVLLRTHQDLLGLALAKLDPIDARLLVARDAFGVPMSAVVRVYTNTRLHWLPDFDYLGHVHYVLDVTRRQLRDRLLELGLSADTTDLDWSNSPAVRQLGKELHLVDRLPCEYCGHPEIPPISPAGRQRRFCSNKCRQAAYRYRVANPDEVDAWSREREQGMMPCFAGLENRIPLQARLELIELVDKGAITVHREEIDHVTTWDGPKLDWRRWRWGPESPLRWTAYAVLSMLDHEEPAAKRIWLHGTAMAAGSWTHWIGFECRYLGGALKRLADGADEWIEIPRPTRRAPVIGLRIRTADSTALAERPRQTRDPRPTRYFR